VPLGPEPADLLPGSWRRWLFRGTDHPVTPRRITGQLRAPSSVPADRERLNDSDRVLHLLDLVCASEQFTTFRGRVVDRSTQAG
jgi:hypothetical protein